MDQPTGSKLVLMLACPYCAEQVPDDTVICPYCRSDVRVRPGPPMAAQVPRVGDGGHRFSHSGGRHLLGFGPDFFGVWDRERPGGPVARFPRTDDGWRDAWLHFVALEPHPSEIGLPGGPPPVRTAASRIPGPASPRPVSAAWWLLPILFGTIGGVVAWALTRGRDPRVAKNMLLTGIALSLVLLFIYMVSGPSS
jgi:hypothetical protein